MNPIPLPEAVAAVVGVFMPIIIGQVKNLVESKQLRFVIALVISGVVGTIGAMIAGADLSWINVAEFTTIAFGMSQAAHNLMKNL